MVVLGTCRNNQISWLYIRLESVATFNSRDGPGGKRSTGSFVRSNVASRPNAAQRLHARTTSALIYNGARSSYVFRARRAFKTRVDDAHLAATKLPTFRTKRSKRRRGFLPHDWTILGKCPLPSRTPSSHAKGKRFLPERFP